MMMPLRNLLTIALAVASSFSAISCKQRQVFQVKGVVEEVMLDRKKVKIAHERIPHYMDAMTMVFDVKSTNELANLQPGDSVSFRMVVTGDDGWIEQVTKLASAAPQPVVVTPPQSTAPDAFRRVREVEPLKAGDVVPDYRFTNELGQAVSLRDFRGQALAFTFIFTRCPFPTFCPRMSDNFSAAQARLKAMANGPTNWHLLAITFDPQFDTPVVLNSYAKRFKYDPRHWSFATGDLTDITAIAEQFGLLFWRPDPKQLAGITHNLRTVVVDAQGRVQKVFTENEWKVEELVAEIVKAAEAKP